MSGQPGGKGAGKGITHDGSKMSGGREGSGRVGRVKATHVMKNLGNTFEKAKNPKM